MDRAFPRLPHALGVAFVLAGGLLAACSGGSSGTGTTPPATTATATPTPAVTATPTPVPTPTPSPVISSTSTPPAFIPATAASPAIINFTNSAQSMTITVSEPGYTGTFSVALDIQNSGANCTGTIAAVSPPTGSGTFTLTSSSSAAACGNATFNVTDSHLTDTPLTVYLTQTNVGIQSKHRKKH
jgi:hypothetical protein